MFVDNKTIFEMFNSLSKSIYCVYRTVSGAIKITSERLTSSVIVLKGTQFKLSHRGHKKAAAKGIYIYNDKMRVCIPVHTE